MGLFLVYLITPDVRTAEGKDAYSCPFTTNSSFEDSAAWVLSFQRYLLLLFLLQTSLLFKLLSTSSTPSTLHPPLSTPPVGSVGVILITPQTPDVTTSTPNINADRILRLCNIYFMNELFVVVVCNPPINVCHFRVVIRLNNSCCFDAEFEI